MWVRWVEPQVSGQPGHHRQERPVLQPVAGAPGVVDAQRAALPHHRRVQVRPRAPKQHVFPTATGCRRKIPAHELEAWIDRAPPKCCWAEFTTVVHQTTTWLKL